ncbi:MAG: DUF4333 domain-containing protein [Actinomycetota bacterium]|nr:DUF4333 domain-containing protein [Actinomycetota bacterium]
MFRVPRSVVVCVSMLVLALALSACGSFDSAASGEHLIKDYVKKYGQGKVSVESVSCPSGVKQKVGTTYDCPVKLHDATSNANSSGTITIHMASGNKVEIQGKQDLHLH